MAPIPWNDRHLAESGEAWEGHSIEPGERPQTNPLAGQVLEGLTSGVPIQGRVRTSPNGEVFPVTIIIAKL